MNSGNSQAEIFVGDEPEASCPNHDSKRLLVWELPAKNV